MLSMHVSGTSSVDRLSRLLHGASHAGGLKPVQWEAIRYLARANRFSRTPAALTAYLGLTKGTVSQTLQALERKGLIEKRPSQSDQRSVSLLLTSLGDDLLRDDPLNEVSAILTEMDSDLRSQLEEGLSQLIRGLLDRRGGRPFGVCRTCRYFRNVKNKGYRCALLDVRLTRADSEKICVEQEAA